MARSGSSTASTARPTPPSPRHRSRPAHLSLPGSASLADVPVRRGDFLYFIVDPKSGEHRCDSTALDVVIVPLTGVPAFPPAALAALTVLLALIGIIVLRRG